MWVLKYVQITNCGLGRIYSLKKGISQMFQIYVATSSIFIVPQWEIYKTAPEKMFTYLFM